jgi:hypothetical protein
MEEGKARFQPACEKSTIKRLIGRYRGGPGNELLID